MSERTINHSDIAGGASEAVDAFWRQSKANAVWEEPSTGLLENSMDAKYFHLLSVVRELLAVILLP